MFSGAEKSFQKEKTFCILLYGGYSSHYEIAFPLLKELNVHADAFIPMELVARTYYPGIEKFILYFSWEEASEMHQSGLVNIYRMWHPFDEGKDMTAEVRTKAEEIKRISPAVTSNRFFLFPSNKHSQDVSRRLKTRIWSDI